MAFGNERYKCDRNGGAPVWYLRRKPWLCPSCGQESRFAGHICQDCHRRVCCDCFHHDLAACLTAPGSDCVLPGEREKLIAPCPGKPVRA